jgi:cell division protein FtsB
MPPRKISSSTTLPIIASAVFALIGYMATWVWGASALTAQSKVHEQRIAKMEAERNLISDEINLMKSELLREMAKQSERLASVETELRLARERGRGR